MTDQPSRLDVLGSTGSSTEGARDRIGWPAPLRPQALAAGVVGTTAHASQVTPRRQVARAFDSIGGRWRVWLLGLPMLAAFGAMGVLAAEDLGGGSPTPGPRTHPMAAGDVFHDLLSDGRQGPAMVVIPAGQFRMGCLSKDGSCNVTQKPVREVSIPTPFALSAHEVTFADYDSFTHPDKVDDEAWGRAHRPVVNVSWAMAQDYVAWLSAQTGERYRLPTEAEWEYAARGRHYDQVPLGGRDRPQPGKLP